jgi:hypothetical protein
MIKLAKEAIDLVIKGANLVFGSGPVLDFLDFVNDVAGDLLSPLFAFVKVVDFPDVPQTTGPFLLLFVHKGPFHRPPPVQHSLSLFAISGHFKMFFIIDSKLGD